jgi:hypothetical protein
MKPGDLVRFVRKQVDQHIHNALGLEKMYLRADAVGIVIKKVRHLPDSWIVNFPALGGMDGYPSTWLEIIDEDTKR